MTKVRELQILSYRDREGRICTRVTNESGKSVLYRSTDDDPHLAEANVEIEVSEMFQEFDNE